MSGKFVFSVAERRRERALRDEDFGAPNEMPELVETSDDGEKPIYPEPTDPGDAEADVLSAKAEVPTDEAEADELSAKAEAPTAGRDARWVRPGNVRGTWF